MIFPRLRMEIVFGKQSPSVKNILNFR